MPLVSAGIPVFQGAKFLDETLRSLRSQDYPNLEIVVCDNASTDRTAQIAQEHTEADPRVRLVVNTTNIGAAPNYNKVFEASHGEYFAWNAHDDHSSPGFLRSAEEALASDSDAVVALPRSFRVDLEGNRLEEFEVPAGFNPRGRTYDSGPPPGRTQKRSSSVCSAVRPSNAPTSTAVSPEATGIS